MQCNILRAQMEMTQEEFHLRPSVGLFAIKWESKSSFSFSSSFNKMIGVPIKHPPAFKKTNGAEHTQLFSPWIPRPLPLRGVYHTERLPRLNSTQCRPVVGWQMFHIKLVTERHVVATNRLRKGTVRCPSDLVKKRIFFFFFLGFLYCYLNVGSSYLTSELQVCK